MVGHRLARLPGMGGGLVYTGLATEADRIGLTFAHAEFRAGYRHRRPTRADRILPTENVIELTYPRAPALADRQLDMQYVVGLTGGSTRHNALAVELRVEIGR